jgi:hypothetical protein
VRTGGSIRLPVPCAPAAAIVSTGADTVELGAAEIKHTPQPNTGMIATDIADTATGEVVTKIPGVGKLVAPVVNETIEALKNSEAVRGLQDRVNGFGAGGKK